jgi:VanZ family protein
MLWFAFGAWLILLTILSSEDGFTTAQTSGRLTVFVMGLFRIPALHQAKVESILRISAHFVLFFVLGGLLYSVIRITWDKAGSAHLWALGICFILGIMDEVKKVFIAGRHLSWEEAGLNVIGAWCGIIFAMVVIHFIEIKWTK